MRRLHWSLAFPNVLRPFFFVNLFTFYFAKISGMQYIESCFFLFGSWLGFFFPTRTLCTRERALYALFLFARLYFISSSCFRARKLIIWGLRVSKIYIRKKNTGIPEDLSFCFWNFYILIKKAQNEFIGLLPLPQENFSCLNSSEEKIILP